MERYTIEQRVKVIQAYYENGRSNQNVYRRKSSSVMRAHFHLSGFVNKQNCPIWANDNPRVIVEKPMHPQRVSVWCGLWAGGIIGPYFFQNEAGQAVRLLLQRETELPATGSLLARRARSKGNEKNLPNKKDMDVDDMWFQQDGATCHTANEKRNNGSFARQIYNSRVRGQL